MSRRAVFAWLVLALAAGAQQAPNPLLPSNLPVRISGGALDLTLESAFRAHPLKGESFAYVQFSHDGKTLLTSGSDGTARISKLSGEMIQRVENGNMVFKARFDSTGDRFITSVYDGSARVWSRDGKLLREYRDHRSAVTDALFLGNGAISSGSDDGSVLILTEEGKLAARITQQGVARNQAVSHDGKWLACAFESGHVRILDSTGKVAHEFAAGEGRINDIRFSPAGNSVLTSGFDGFARLWTLDGKPLLELAAGDGDWVYNAQFSRDGRMIGTVSGTGLVVLWSADGKKLAEYRSGNGRVNAIDFSPVEDRFAVIDHNGVVLVFEYKAR